MEKVVLTTLGLLKRYLFKACGKKVKRNKFMKLVEYFLFAFDIFKAINFFTENYILFSFELTT